MKSILTRTATVLVTLTAVATLVGGTSSSVAADSSLTPATSTELAALPAGPSPSEVGYRIGSTPEQQAEWAALVATPESRAQLVADLKESFAGVAEVHVETGGTAGRFGAMPDLAYGYNGHVWMTLSYADAANGLISTAVWYCSTKIPGWICNSLGNVLRWLVSGWGWANNHGVWGAAYWSGYVTGGRW